MFDMTKETGAFHNIYKTGIGAETEKRTEKESWKRLPVELGFDVDRGGIRNVHRKDI